MVVRPTAPTKPDDYTGMQHWTVAKQQAYTTATSVSPSNLPTETEYILGNKANAPGWGAWTIGKIVLTNTQKLNTNFIWHSFGMVGTKTAPTYTPMSYLKTWG